MSRLHLNTSFEDMAWLMSEGNPGALNVVLSLLNVDDFHYLLMCDTLELYGVNLYLFAHDCCGDDKARMKRVIDSWQRGGIAADEIHDHVSHSKPFADDSGRLANDGQVGNAMETNGNAVAGREDAGSPASEEGAK